MIGRKVVPSGVVKHDTAAHWDAMDANENYTCTYVPQAGEIIVYDADSENENARMKVGDGQTIVALLPFTAGRNAGGSGDTPAATGVAIKRLRVVLDPSEDWSENQTTNEYEAEVQNQSITSDMYLLEWEADPGYDFPWTVSYETGSGTLTITSQDEMTSEIRGYATLGVDASELAIDISQLDLSNLVTSVNEQTGDITLYGSNIQLSENDSTSLSAAIAAAAQTGGSSSGTTTITLVRLPVDIDPEDDPWTEDSLTGKFTFTIDSTVAQEASSIKSSMGLVEWEAENDFPFDVTYRTANGSVTIIADEEITVPVSGTLVFAMNADLQIDVETLTGKVSAIEGYNANSRLTNLENTVNGVEAADPEDSEEGLTDKVSDLEDRLSAIENEEAVFLVNSNGDYEINTNVVADMTNNDQCQSNTISKWNNFLMNIRTKTAISANSDTVLIKIPEESIDVLGVTYVRSIGQCGSNAVAITFDTWNGPHSASNDPEDHKGTISVKSSVALASGSNIVCNMTFPVTPYHE